MIIIEHDPLLYENAAGMIDLASQAMRDAAKEAIVLLYSPVIDTFPGSDKKCRLNTYFDEGPRAAIKFIAKAYPIAQKSQTTLEAWT